MISKKVKYKIVLSKCLSYFLFSVWLVGGKNNSEGNVFAFNPANSKSGPVCHDNWNIAAVS
jgi:hypothetical protein